MSEEICGHGRYIENKCPECDCVQVKNVTPKQTEAESVENVIARCLIDHDCAKGEVSMSEVLCYAFKKRDAAMMEKGRREERERAVDICRKYGAVHMIDAMRGGIQ